MKYIRKAEEVRKFEFPSRSDLSRSILQSSEFRNAVAKTLAGACLGAYGAAPQTPMIVEIRFS